MLLRRPSPPALCSVLCPRPSKRFSHCGRQGYEQEAGQGGQGGDRGEGEEKGRGGEKRKARNTGARLESNEGV